MQPEEGDAPTVNSYLKIYILSVQVTGVVSVERFTVQHILCAVVCSHVLPYSTFVKHSQYSLYQTPQLKVLCYCYFE